MGIKTIKIKEFADVISGSTPKTNIDEYWNGEFRWITPKEIKEDSKYIDSTERTLTKEGIESCSLRVLKENTILLTSRAPIGKVALVGKTMYCNQGFKNLICNEEIVNPEYIYYWLSSQTEYLNSLGRGATFKEISKKIVEDIEVPIQELEAQNKIVEALDKSQELIDKRKEQIEALDELVKSRFIEMFGNKEYKKQELGSLIVEGSTLSYGIIVPGDNVKHGVEMIRPLNFINGKIELNNLYKVDSAIEEKYAKTRLLGDEILIQVIGEPGKVTLTTPECKGMNVTRNLAVLRQNNEVINKYYLKEYLRGNEAQSFINTGINKSTLKQLPLGILRKLNVQIPAIGLQNEFADFVNQVDKLKLGMETSLKELENNFNSLMQKAFKGELFN